MVEVKEIVIIAYPKLEIIEFFNHHIVSICSENFSIVYYNCEVK